jgi:hypothetical protein
VDGAASPRRFSERDHMAQRAEILFITVREERQNARLRPCEARWCVSLARAAVCEPNHCRPERPERDYDDGEDREACYRHHEPSIRLLGWRLMSVKARAGASTAAGKRYEVCHAIPPPYRRQRPMSGRPRCAISARPAPLPPSKLRMPARPYVRLWPIEILPGLRQCRTNRLLMDMTIADTTFFRGLAGVSARLV